MKRTTLAGFRSELLATGSYRTHDDCRAASRAGKNALTTFRLAWNVGKLFPLTALYDRLGLLTRSRWEKIAFATIREAETLGMNVVFEGWENRVEHKGPVVYVCNHMSSFETIMLPPVMLTFGPYLVAVKDSLAHMPLIGKDLLDFMGMVPIGRRNPREDYVHLLNVCAERRDASVLIFPQGARQRVFDRERVSSLGAKLASRLHYPLCPIAVDTRCLPVRESGALRKVFRDFGTVDTSFDVRCACGPLMEGDSRNLQEQLLEWMADKLSQWDLSVRETGKMV